MNIDDQVWCQVQDQVWWHAVLQVQDQVERQVWHWVRDQVQFDQIRNQVQIRILDQMREEHHEH